MDPNPSNPTPPNPRSHLLRTLSTGPIPSSISNLTDSSRTLPSEKDFHFYSNFDEFKFPIDEIASQSHSMLQQIAPLPPEIEHEGYHWLVNVNDGILERFDSSVDEFMALRKGEENEEGFEVVGGKKMKKESVVGVKVAERDKKAGGVKAKIPFHIPTIKRPQDKYNILVNNANQPFQHVWLERSEDGGRFIHPLVCFRRL